MSTDMLLYVLALLFFALATIGADVKFNTTGAGLFCLTLSLLV